MFTGYALTARLQGSCVRRCAALAVRHCRSTATHAVRVIKLGGVVLAMNV